MLARPIDALRKKKIPIYRLLISNKKLFGQWGRARTAGSPFQGYEKIADDKFELLDGQQRIIGIGRFLTNKFAIMGADGVPHYFRGLAKDLQDKIRDTKFTIFECSGTESEIKEWFKTINITGVPLNEQELSNAIHSLKTYLRAKELGLTIIDI